MAGKNPIKFTDTTFRDGHQSLLATRMRSEDIIPFMERMDQMGYWAIEVWGGATFDTTHRFLGDDPWERIRTIKGILKKTPTSMLLRGQNLVGYRNYADDLTYRFVRYTAEAGVDVFRVFDALNDVRNWEVSVKALMDAKKEGLMAHFQGAMCYTLTQRRLGGPIFNLDYYVKFAKQIEEMGADSVCLKDMAGMCSPNDAYAIIKALKETVKIPVEFHTHYTSGSGSMSYLKAIEAGVDVLDTCLSPFALRTSQPAIEPLLVAVEQTDRESDMDLAALDRDRLRPREGGQEVPGPAGHLQDGPDRHRGAPAPDPRRHVLQPGEPAQGAWTPWTGFTRSWRNCPRPARRWATRRWSPQRPRSSASRR